MSWEQAEADTVAAGLIGGLPLDVKFHDRWTLPIMGGVYVKF